MDIRESIRKAMKEAAVSRNSKWDSESQPNIYELDNFLRKAGYRLVDIIEHTETNELMIEPVKPGYLYPDIVHDVSDKLFYIKVAEHGLLVASDVEEIMKGYTTALSVVKRLEAIDLDSLEVEPDTES